jgi:hypothetical protein
MYDETKVWREIQEVRIACELCGILHFNLAFNIVHRTPSVNSSGTVGRLAFLYSRSELA